MLVRIGGPPLPQRFRTESFTPTCGARSVRRLTTAPIGVTLCRPVHDVATVSITAPDRKRLWGKAANRCAMCNQPLTRPETPHDPESIIGEEAHIVGRRPGAPRYRPLDAVARDGYANRILLCPTHHAEIDAQPGTWPEDRLLRLKQEHEQRMAARTSHGERDGWVVERQPEDTALPLLLSGERVLAVVGPALIYDTGQEPMATEAERDAADALMRHALDWGEIYSSVGPSEHIDAARELDDLLKAAVEEGILLYGALLEATVRMGEERHRWPVGYLRLRRAASVAEEQRTHPATAG